MSLAEEGKENVVYLPHRAVVRNDNDTTKYRTVFDATVKGSTRCSLNDTLLIGSVIHTLLRSSIM